MHYVRESLASEPEMRCGAWGICFISHPAKQDISQCATAHYFIFAARRIFHLNIAFPSSIDIEKALAQRLVLIRMFKSI